MAGPGLWESELNSHRQLRQPRLQGTLECPRDFPQHLLGTAGPPQQVDFIISTLQKRSWRDAVAGWPWATAELAPPKPALGGNEPPGEAPLTQACPAGAPSPPLPKLLLALASHCFGAGSLHLPR